MHICISVDGAKDYILCLNQVRTHLNNSPTKANAQNALHPQCNYFFTFTSEKTYTPMQQSMPYSDSENKLPKCKRKNQMYLNDKQPSSLKF